MDSDVTNKGICEANTVPQRLSFTALPKPGPRSSLVHKTMFCERLCFVYMLSETHSEVNVTIPTLTAHRAALHWYPVALTFPEPALGPALFLCGVAAVNAQCCVHNVCVWWRVLRSMWTVSFNAAQIYCRHLQRVNIALTFSLSQLCSLFNAFWRILIYFSLPERMDPAPVILKQLFVNTCTAFSLLSLKF